MCLLKHEIASKIHAATIPMITAAMTDISTAIVVRYEDSRQAPHNGLHELLTRKKSLLQTVLLLAWSDAGSVNSPFLAAN